MSVRWYGVGGGEVVVMLVKNVNVPLSRNELIVFQPIFSIAFFVVVESSSKNRMHVCKCCRCVM